MSTARIRLHSKKRMARIRAAMKEMRDQWDATDGDPSIENLFDRAERDLVEFETELEEHCQYYDEEIGA